MAVLKCVCVDISGSAGGCIDALHIRSVNEREEGQLRERKKNY